MSVVPANWPAMSIAQAHAMLTAPGQMFEMEEVDVRGVRYRTWKNAPKSLREVVFAGRMLHGPKDFVVYEAERVTYEAFFRASVAFAHKLIEAGVQKGDRVAVIMRNLPEWPVAFFGASLTGAIVAPLNAWWTGSELEYALNDSGAKVAIVDAERLARLQEHLHAIPGLQRIYVTRATEEIAHPSVHRLEDAIGGPSGYADLPEQAAPPVPIDPEDDATLFYTSGTTGRPKGALGTHRNAGINVLNTAVATVRAILRRGEMPPTPSPTDPQKAGLLSIPLFHVTGCMAIMVFAIAAGVKLVLQRRFEPEAAMALIEKEKITSIGGVPTVAWQILEHPNRDKYDLSSLEAVTYGGAPAAPELVRKIKSDLKAAMPGIGWGMTETSGAATGHIGEEYLTHPDSCGVPLPIVDLKIVGANGEEVAPGEVGELWCKSPGNVKLYWNRPDASAETFVDGWVVTGDLARVDADGFYYIVDRAKDMIIRGGENIYSVEVENALYEHPAVMDAAVVPIPHKTLGEEPGAIVALVSGHDATEDELRAFVAERLAAFKVPVRILIQREPLPRNPNGKLLKSELKKLFL